DVGFVKRFSGTCTRTTRLRSSSLSSLLFEHDLFQTREAPFGDQALLRRSMVARMVHTAMRGRRKCAFSHDFTTCCERARAAAGRAGSGPLSRRGAGP